jgi:glycosyltransferase involved in cell wall biosynthesis
VGDVRLRFLHSAHQNGFFGELMEALAAEARALGAEADVVTSPVAPEPEDVFVVLPTHEYRTLEGSAWLDDERTARRTIGLTAEQPGSTFFADNVSIAPRLGGVMDFSAHAVAAYRHQNVEARHLSFGWTASWDTFHEHPTPELDVLFMGSRSGRRDTVLASMSRTLWQRRSRLLISDDSAPNWRPSDTFLLGESKRALLASTKVLVNVHRSNEPYFEWLRIVEAAHCGAVVVTEPSLHREPFVNGEHLEVCTADAIPGTIDRLLDDPDLVSSRRRAAYELLRSQPASIGVAALLDVAVDLARHHPPATRPVGPSRRTPYKHSRPAPWERERTDLDILRQAVREIRLDMVDTKRAAAANQHGRPTETEVRYRSTSWSRRPPRVSVVVALYNHAGYVRDALESAANGTFGDVEVVVTDDGSTDGSGDVVEAWMRESPHVAATLLRHPVNRGLPHARNTSTSYARGELVFVLDADNLLVPTGLERLVRALDAAPNSAFAYGVLQRFDSSGPAGLMGVWPWEPWRLRYENYIDAMALVRRSTLDIVGGYSTDRRLHGWEDFDLWCRIAELGGTAAHVPTVVGRYRSSATSMLSLTNVSLDAGWDALQEHSPTLMAGRFEEYSDDLSSWLRELVDHRRSRADAIDEPGGSVGA